MKIRTAILAAAFACAACDAEPEVPPAGEEVLDGEVIIPGGEEYDATTMIDCTINGIEPVDGCEAGVIRGWSEDGGSLVEITKPDGFTRSIFIGADGVPLRAEGAEADGSAEWDFAATMQGDTHVVDFGPEHYEFPEAFVTGE